MAHARTQPVLDVQPFMDTFAHALSHLQRIKGDMDDRTAALNSAVQVSQSVYTKKIRQLTNNFDMTQSSFDALQSRISEVGRTAIRIGEQLESLDRQRKRASETHDLIEYYYMFARGDTSRLDKLRKEHGREGRLKAATILRRLAVISREVDIDGSTDTREKIERYCEQFERDMLKLFDKYYRRSDPKMMSHIAHVLQRFNGGMSCINIYVNQHDFFISKDRVDEAGRIGVSPVWAHVADPMAAPPRSEPSLEALYTEIRRTVELEAQIIAAVFPTPLLVMQMFLQRVFAQSVQSYVETIMDKALALDTEAAGLARHDPTVDSAGLAFLRMLHVTRSATLQLVSDLKAIDLRSAGITTSAPTPTAHGLDGLFSLSGAEADALMGNEGYSAAQLAAAGGSVLGAMLDQSVEEMFSPYLDHVRYIDRECRVLSSLYAGALQRFFAWHRNTIKASRANATIFSRVREQFTGGSGSLGSSVAFATLADSGGYGAAPQVSSFKRLVDRARGVSMPDDTDEDAVAMGDEADERGELALSLVQRMLQWYAEALGRCVDLCASSDVPKSTFLLLRVLTDAYLKAYVEAALETATVQMFAYDGRASTAPELMVMTLVQRVEQLIELWQHYIQTAVLPLTAASVTIRRETAIYNHHNMLRVEGKCEALLQKYTDNLLAYLQGRLATQKRNDYNPKNDEMTFTQLNTEPCLAIVDALEAFEAEVRAKLSERTRESLCTDVGIGFHALLCEHLKKFTVSATGGLMLTKDLAMYQDACNRFHIAVVQDRFEMLRQLGTLFIVQPGVLKSYMREGHLSTIDEALLRPYLQRRQDYASDVRVLDDETQTGAEDTSRQGTSLLASLSQHTVLGSAWTDNKKEPFSRDLRMFVTDMPDLPGLVEHLVHPPTEGPGSGRSTPTRSTTPQSHLHSAHGSPGGGAISRTPSPVKPSRRAGDRPSSLQQSMHNLDLS